MHGILYLIGYGHVLKASLALSVPVEVKADRGYAVCLQAVGQYAQQVSFLVGSESVADDDQRDALVLCIGGSLDDCCQASVVALQTHGDGGSPGAPGQHGEQEQCDGNLFHSGKWVSWAVR